VNLFKVVVFNFYKILLLSCSFFKIKKEQKKSFPGQGAYFVMATDDLINQGINKTFLPS